MQYVGPGGKPPCASGTYPTREAGTRSLYVPYEAPGRTRQLGVELHELEVLERQARTRDHATAVALVRVRLRAREG